MKSLLKNSESLLAHSTACYEYKYEFTIFHVHFYTGKSLNYLLNDTGLSIAGHYKDTNSEYDCYVFKSTSPQITTE